MTTQNTLFLGRFEVSCYTIFGAEPRVTVTFYNTQGGKESCVARETFLPDGLELAKLFVASCFNGFDPAFSETQIGVFQRQVASDFESVRRSLSASIVLVFEAGLVRQTDGKKCVMN